MSPCRPLSLKSKKRLSGGITTKAMLGTGTMTRLCQGSKVLKPQASLVTKNETPLLPKRLLSGFQGAGGLKRKSTQKCFHFFCISMSKSSTKLCAHAMLPYQEWHDPLQAIVGYVARNRISTVWLHEQSHNSCGCLRVSKCSTPTLYRIQTIHFT